jgi:predicted acyl esterase
MWATAYRFRRGHRLRLQVSSGAHPRWNRNLGTGEPIATATAMLAAEQSVYHDHEHPSAVIMPVSTSHL